MLPAEYSVRVTQNIRIAVGYKKDDGIPDTLDHFRMTRWDASLKRYVLDQEATKAVGEKPTELDVMVLGNLIRVPDPWHEGDFRLEVPDWILWRRMAYYWGKRCVCSCGDFRPKTQAEAAADDLAWPLDPDTRHSWIGTYTRRKFEDGKLVKTTSGDCNPYTCPWATGEHDMKKYAGVPLCKPQTILNVQLMGMPRLGAMAKFVTSSW